MSQYGNYQSAAFKQLIKNENSLSKLKKVLGREFNTEVINKGVDWLRKSYQQTVFEYPGDNIYYEEFNFIFSTGNYSFKNAKIKVELNLYADLQIKQFTYLTTGKI